MSFNVFVITSNPYGGRYSILRDIKAKLTAGGTIPATHRVLVTTIPAGPPVYIPNAGAEAQFLEFYKVTGSSSTDKTVTIAKGDLLPSPKVDDFVMVTPTTMGGTGQSRKVTAVAVDTDGNYVLTFATALTAADGSLLTLAAGTAESATAKMLVADCNGLIENEVYFQEGTYAATCAAVYHGAIWVDRINPIPQIVKDRLPMILFQAGI